MDTRAFVPDQSAISSFLGVTCIMLNVPRSQTATADTPPSSPKETQLTMGEASDQASALRLKGYFDVHRLEHLLGDFAFSESDHQVHSLLNLPT